MNLDRERRMPSASTNSLLLNISWMFDDKLRREILKLFCKLFIAINCASTKNLDETKVSPKVSRNSIKATNSFCIHICHCFGCHVLTYLMFPSGIWLSIQNQIRGAYSSKIEDMCVGCNVWGFWLITKFCRKRKCSRFEDFRDKFCLSTWVPNCSGFHTIWMNVYFIQTYWNSSVSYKAEIEVHLTRLKTHAGGSVHD